MPWKEGLGIFEIVLKDYADKGQKLKHKEAFQMKILFLLLSYCRKLPRLASANIFRLKYCQNHIVFFHVMSNMDNFSSTTLRRGLLPSVNSRDDINVQFKSEYGDY